MVVHINKGCLMEIEIGRKQVTHRNKIFFLTELRNYFANLILHFITCSLMTRELCPFIIPQPINTNYNYKHCATYL